MIRKPTALDITLIIAITAIWSSTFPALKIAVPDLGPLWITALRAFLGFLVLLPWGLARGMVFPAGGRQWGLVIVLAMLNAVAPFFLLSYAGLYIGAGMIALLMGTGPFFALILNHLMTDDERMNRFKVAAVVLGFAGIALVLGPAALKGTHTDIVGQLCVLAAGLSYAVSGVLIRKVHSLPPTRLSVLVLGLASLVMMPAALISGQPQWSAVPRETIYAVIYLGLLPTGLGYLARYYLVGKVGYGFFSLGLNLIPVFGVILGAVLLGEAITLTVVTALALVLAGLAVARLGAYVPSRTPIQ